MLRVVPAAGTSSDTLVSSVGVQTGGQVLPPSVLIRYVYEEALSAIHEMLRVRALLKSSIVGLNCSTVGVGGWGGVGMSLRRAARSIRVSATVSPAIFCDVVMDTLTRLPADGCTVASSLPLWKVGFQAVTFFKINSSIPLQVSLELGPTVLPGGHVLRCQGVSHTVLALAGLPVFQGFTSTRRHKLLSFTK